MDDNSGYIKNLGHSHIPYLVGGLEHDFYEFPYIGNIIPTDEFHHFSEGLIYHQPDIYHKPNSFPLVIKHGVENVPFSTMILPFKSLCGGIFLPWFFWTPEGNNITLQ